jgi:hypothetical protein
MPPPRRLRLHSFWSRKGAIAPWRRRMTAVDWNTQRIHCAGINPDAQQFGAPHFEWKKL